MQFKSSSVFCWSIIVGLIVCVFVQRREQNSRLSEVERKNESLLSELGHCKQSIEMYGNLSAKIIELAPSNGGDAEDEYASRLGFIARMAEQISEQLGALKKQSHVKEISSQKLIQEHEN